MKLAFMSSVLPKATLAELSAVGQKYGYEGIELRPEWEHGHGVELSATAEQRKELAKVLADGPLDPCCLSPGTKFASPDPAERDAQFDAICEYIRLAAEVGIGRIRVFGDPLPNGGGRAACYAWQAEYLARAAAEAKAAGVMLVIETHMNFRACDAGEILYRTEYPEALRVNWHLGHCLAHGEDVDEAYRHVKGRVAHAHFGFPAEQGGKDKICRQAELLLAEGFDGFFSVEFIGPENPHEILASHADQWQALRKDLGF